MVDGKETIYIDADDEITGIIDKVRSSKQKIVALVLPKRATVFHSIVNMKLLKRAAEEANKRPVLITSEAGILPLAGAVGMHVAKTLQSRPEIPEAAPTAPVSEATGAEIDKSKPVGVLAGLTPDEEDETIEVDNAEDAAPTVATASSAKKALNKKLKVPNFDRFRTRLFLGLAALVLLIIGWIFAAVVLPKAKVTIKTDTTTVASNINFTASPKAKELDKDNSIVPAETKNDNKTDAQSAGATGQKNVGTKATGTMTLTNCINDGQFHTVPAGTGFTSGQFTFLTTESVTLDPALYSGSTCKSSNFGLSKTVNVAAVQPGDQYNLSSRSYSPPASLTTSNGSVSANGSNMTGGTSQIVKVVAQSDVDGAKQKIIDQDSQAEKDALSKKLNDDGYIPVTDTFATANPVVTTTPNVGDQADQVNVSLTITYTMLGAKKDDVKQLLENDIKQHIDASKQNIIDNGLDKATLTVTDKRSNGDVKISLQSQAVAGVAPDKDDIKRIVAGKKKGEARDIILTRPGVKDVNISYSPFWVTKAPKKLSKITVVFQQSNANANSSP